jgi:hypothetical protein
MKSSYQDSILKSFTLGTIYQLPTNWLKQEGWNGCGMEKIRNADTVVDVQPEHTRSLQISWRKLGWWVVGDITRDLTEIMYSA